MAGNKFARLNAKGNDKQEEPTPTKQETQTPQPTNTLINKPTNQQTNKLVDVRTFAPTFANLPDGTGIRLDVEDLRFLLIQVGKEQRSFSLHHIEKDALDRATFLLKVQGLKADANKIARAALVKGLADLEEKGKDSFLYQMLDNLSH